MPHRMSAQILDTADNASARTISLDELEHPAVRAGVAYWRSLKAGRKMPARSQLSPRDMGGILRNVILVRVIDGGQDYEFRIAGDAHVQAFAFQFKNLRLSHLNAPALSRTLRDIYERVRLTAEPFATRGRVDDGISEALFSYYESARLPLAEDGETVDHILTVANYVRRARGFAI